MLQRRWPQMRFGLRGIATQARYTRKANHLAWAGFGSAAVGLASWLYLRQDSRLPTPWQYVPLTLHQATYLPPSSGIAFDLQHIPIHRALHIQAPYALTLPQEADMDKIRCRLAIYAYYIKEPTIQVERAYTPLFMMHKIDPTMLHFTIKRYGSGELSRYLYRIPTGATVSLRGPELTWKLDPSLDVPKEVVMVCMQCTNRSLLQELA
ncbi:hypothetical protein ACI68E_002258 [Malassezia pachydermatis]